MTPKTTTTDTLYSPEPSRAEFVDHHEEIGDQRSLAASSIWDALFKDIEHAKNERTRERYAANLRWALFGARVMVLPGSAEWVFFKFLTEVSEEYSID